MPVWTEATTKNQQENKTFLIFFFKLPAPNQAPFEAICMKN